ncbi:soluble NSF attachment protein [Cokeromyces recurvatus]|uniref:soluble NSF attachment protein n=1 Tax=Cokeromyces recurvatus TaxID=90255 RepID=UPI00221ECF96|nr:soluble NSF attachment protein [Cokeromyces recurvatus]KAI7903974.1 soluble NSF attachment protein [Cokeromyces recurvatus]
MSEHQAQDLLLQAEKKLNSWAWFNSSNKHEDAAEMYEKAGNTFKLAQKWNEAGKAYIKAAELYKTAPTLQYESSKSFESASKCLKRIDAKAALEALQKAIIIDKEIANFRNAAKHHQEIADIYESDIMDLKGAKENWEEASKLYMADDSTAMVNKCLLKVAHFAAQLEQYDEAIENFERVATDSMNNQLTKWSIKEYFLKASLCSMCIGDSVKTRQLLNKYYSMDLSFENTREYQFLLGILDCFDNGDQPLFSQKIHEFDQISKLDNWKIGILLRIKKSMDSSSLLL